jgi:hypothetical protein
VPALYARHPSPSATHVCRTPAVQVVSPADAQVFVQLTQDDASAQAPLPSVQALPALKARQPLLSATQVLTMPDAQEVSPANEQVLLQVAQDDVSAQALGVHAVPAFKAKQPLASATQVCSTPASHTVSPAEEQVLVHVPHEAESPQKLSGQADPAFHARQPLPSATQVRTVPSTQEVCPAAAQAFVQPVHDDPLAQDPPSHTVPASKLKHPLASATQVCRTPLMQNTAPAAAQLLVHPAHDAWSAHDPSTQGVSLSQTRQLLPWTQVLTTPALHSVAPSTVHGSSQSCLSLQPAARVLASSAVIAKLCSHDFRAIRVILTLVQCRPAAPTRETRGSVM